MLKLNLQFFRQLPAREKTITLSSWVTIARMLLTPIIIWSMIYHYWGTAFALFVTACLTDMLDGNIARLRGEQTFLGAVLDPIADKLLILSCFFTLAFIKSPLFTVPKWFFSIVLIKELILIAGAILIFLIKGHIQVTPLLLGKFTTVVQMGFIMWLFACYFFAWVPIKTYYSMLGILLILIIASFIQYSAMGIAWLQKK